LIGRGGRAALARVLLLLLLGAEAPPSALRDAPARLPEAASWIRPGPAVTPGFGFDPGYAAFVDAVRKATPESARIALFFPRTTDLYVYRAVYGLVPRVILPAEDWSRADYVAVYGAPAPPPVPSGRPLPGGTLLQR
jgi:hypothetical protein